MAIAYLDVRTLSRSTGQSYAKAMAYRHGLKLFDAVTGESHDYRRRREHQEIVATGLARCPGLDDSWSLGNPQLIATRIDQVEKRCNSVVARDAITALPAELDHRQRVALAKKFTDWLAKRTGAPVAWAMHAPSQDGDERNHHIHALLLARRIEPDGIALSRTKDRTLANWTTGKVELKLIRATWQDMANAQLKAAKSEARIDMSRKRPLDHVFEGHKGPRQIGRERRRQRAAGIKPDGRGVLARAAQLDDTVIAFPLSQPTGPAPTPAPNEDVDVVPLPRTSQHRERRPERRTSPQPPTLNAGTPTPQQPPRAPRTTDRKRRRRAPRDGRPKPPMAAATAETASSLERAPAKAPRPARKREQRKPRTERPTPATIEAGAPQSPTPKRPTTRKRRRRVRDTERDSMAGRTSIAEHHRHFAAAMPTLAGELEAAAEPMGETRIHVAAEDREAARAGYARVLDAAPGITGSADLKAAAVTATNRSLKQRGIHISRASSPADVDRACDEWRRQVRTDVGSMIAQMLEAMLAALDRQTKKAKAPPGRNLHLDPRPSSTRRPSEPEALPPLAADVSPDDRRAYLAGHLAALGTAALRDLARGPESDDRRAPRTEAQQTIIDAVARLPELRAIAVAPLTREDFTQARRGASEEDRRRRARAVHQQHEESLQGAIKQWARGLADPDRRAELVASLDVDLVLATQAQEHREKLHKEIPELGRKLIARYAQTGDLSAVTRTEHGLAASPELRELLVSPLRPDDLTRPVRNGARVNLSRRKRNATITAHRDRVRDGRRRWDTLCAAPARLEQLVDQVHERTWPAIEAGRRQHAADQRRADSASRTPQSVPAPQPEPEHQSPSRGGGGLGE